MPQHQIVNIVVTRCSVQFHTTGSVGVAAESETLQRIPDLVAVPKTIDDLYSTLGREWVGKGLTELVDQIQIVFKEVGAEDRAGLARRAHMLVSRAGMFGFSELAELCGQLEQATKRGQPLEPYVARLQTLGQAAQSVALQILQKHNTDFAALVVIAAHQYGAEFRDRPHSIQAPLFGFTFPGSITLGGWLADAPLWHSRRALRASGLISICCPRPL